MMTRTAADTVAPADAVPKGAAGDGSLPLHVPSSSSRRTTGRAVPPLEGAARASRALTKGLVAGRQVPDLPPTQTVTVTVTVASRSTHRRTRCPPKGGDSLCPPPPPLLQKAAAAALMRRTLPPMKKRRPTQRLSPHNPEPATLQRSVPKMWSLSPPLLSTRARPLPRKTRQWQSQTWPRTTLKASL